MTEHKIIYTSREVHDKPKDEITWPRLLQIYGEDDLRKFLRFVRNLQKEERDMFCVSRKDNPKTIDRDLLFFEIGGAEDRKLPQIVYLGQMMGKGSIEIKNRFAAETYGYPVLKLSEKRENEVKNKRFKG